jgi:hypothetical protein
MEGELWIQTATDGRWVNKTVTDGQILTVFISGVGKGCEILVGVRF